MRGKDISVGETYLFLATDSQARKHLEGQPFTVDRIEPVWRRLGGRSRRVKRYYNQEGDAARAEELEPIDATSLKASGYLIDTDKTINPEGTSTTDDPL
jgi:hypothetical protein